MTGMPLRSLDQTPLSCNLLRISPEIPNRLEYDPRVVLYPTFGFPISGDVWRVLVHGRICQDVPTTFSKRLMLRGLIRALELPKEVAEGPLFAERVDGFIAGPISGQRVQVELAGQHYVLRRKSKRSGLFSCKLDLPSKQLKPFKTYGQLEPFVSAGAASVAWGETPDVGCPVLLAEHQGISVISDIDDTIKLTEVNSRRRMLQRTFSEPFEAIDGMAAVYQRWAIQGAMFHYVSSSPWQIYSPIEQFLRRSGFPVGSMHLKWFRLRDEIFKRWQIIRRKSKGGVIRGLLKRLPGRTFILVGDSGERDPEIYAKLASKYPRQIARICIRQIDANPLDNARLQGIYRRYGMTVPIQVFANAMQLGDLMH